MANQEDSVVTELDKRLEDLFGEDIPEDVLKKSPSPLEPHKELKPVSPKKKTSSQKMSASGNSIEGLDGLLLSLDWELDDKTFAEYLEEIQRIRHAYTEDKIVVHFFQMLDSLGRYLHSRKAKAHPETIRIMQEIQERLGEILIPKEMLPETRKREILKIAYKRFQDFKELISTTGPQKKSGPMQNGTEGKTNPPPLAGEIALQEVIRNMIREEFEKFREQLLKDLMASKQ